MFNGKGYNLSDIAAVTRGNGDNNGLWGGDGAWWIILLFLFAGGWGNGGGWGGGGNVGTSREIPFRPAQAIQDTVYALDFSF